KLGHAMSWGLPAELISPEEAKGKIAILNTDRVYGAYYVPSDGIAKGVRICEALANQARERGATFCSHTRVTGIEAAHGRIQAVVSTEGRIQTDRVLV